MAYLEVHMIGREQLMAIVRGYPQSYRALRICVLKLAFQRAMSHIKDMVKTQGISPDDAVQALGKAISDMGSSSTAVTLQQQLVDASRKTGAFEQAMLFRAQQRQFAASLETQYIQQRHNQGEKEKGSKQRHNQGGRRPTSPDLREKARRLLSSDAAAPDSPSLFSPESSGGTPVGASGGGDELVSIKVPRSLLVKLLEEQQEGGKAAGPRPAPAVKSEKGFGQSLAAGWSPGTRLQPLDEQQQLLPSHEGNVPDSMRI